MSWSRHLTTGLRLLGERWWPRKWLAAGENWLDTGLRWAMVVGGGWALWRLVSASWKALGVVVLVVVVKALRAATKAAKAPPRKAAAGPEPVSPEAFLTLLWRTLGDAKGVHLRTLAAALAVEYGGGWEVADVRALCEAAGVTVTPTVRAPGGGPTVGVYRADVPPLPRPFPEERTPPSGGVVVAGQTATTAATTVAPTTPTTPTVTTHGGVRVVVADDPDNPARAHVKVVQAARKGR